MIVHNQLIPFDKWWQTFLKIKLSHVQRIFHLINDIYFHLREYYWYPE